jgi:hypothetical protein
VALGNVVVAMTTGKDIAKLRLEQMGEAQTDSFKDIDLSVLHFSPKMKGFLKKLTASTPALRYQSARQALDDLTRLEQLSEEVVTKKTVTIERSESMGKLLGILKERDRMYAYHVPEGVILNEYDDDSLLEHLTKMYSKPNFVIDDVTIIKKYRQPGDKVITKKEIVFHNQYLKKGNCVKITDVLGFGDQVRVLYDDEHLTLKNSEIGTKSWGHFISFQGRMRELLDIRDGDSHNEVFYIGADLPLKKGAEVVPASCIGVYLFSNALGDYVFWNKQQGLVQNQYQNMSEFDHTSGKWTYGLRIDNPVKIDDLRLEIPNPIDFDKLKAACFSR